MDLVLILSLVMIYLGVLSLAVCAVAGWVNILTVQSVSTEINVQVWFWLSLALIAVGGMFIIAVALRVS